MPRIQVKDDGDHLFYIDDVSRTGWTLVYFYPKADTPGCTAQACSLRDHYQDLLALRVSIYGVSRDKTAELKKFKAKFSIPFAMISDGEGRLINAFGVPTWFGFSSRQAYLFRDGVLVWRDLVGSTRTQGDDVLRAIQAWS